MERIDLMIAGAQKAGTTSLKNYLGKHPALVTHAMTEFAFFVNEEEYREGFPHAMKKYFPDEAVGAGKKIIAKNAGLYIDDKALQRLYDHNPECIVVFIIRHPVERAYSSFNMERESGWFKKPWSDIAESLSKFNHGEKDQMFRLFIELGLYAEHLKKILRIFPRQQCHLILFDELKSDPAAVCTRLFRLLAVDDSVKVDTSAIHNPTNKVRSKGLGRFLIWLMENDNPVKIFAKKLLPMNTFVKIRNWLFSINTSSIVVAQPSMPPEIREQLIAFFKPYNDELALMTGLKLEHWNE